MVRTAEASLSCIVPYTQGAEVLVIRSTNLEYKRIINPLDSETVEGGCEARIKNTWYNQGYCRDHMNGAEENL
ncbi:hypothetical protein Tco_0180769 [Tanacetum coccineum]